MKKIIALSALLAGFLFCATSSDVLASDIQHKIKIHKPELSKKGKGSTKKISKRKTASAATPAPKAEIAVGNPGAPSKSK